MSTSKETRTSFWETSHAELCHFSSKTESKNCHNDTVLMWAVILYNYIVGKKTSLLNLVEIVFEKTGLSCLQLLINIYFLPIDPGALNPGFLRIWNLTFPNIGLKKGGVCDWGRLLARKAINPKCIERKLPLHISAVEQVSVVYSPSSLFRFYCLSSPWSCRDWQIHVIHVKYIQHTIKAHNVP